MLTNQDYQIKLIDFPSKGSEAITRNEDGTYTIFINAKLSHDRQFSAYLHAIKHIKNNDFDYESAETAEILAHNI